MRNLEFLSKFDKNGLISSLSISEVTAPIKIYPNPFDEFLNIENLKDGIFYFLTLQENKLKLV